jgi:multidrug efflux system outer membrane protein
MKANLLLIILLILTSCYFEPNFNRAEIKNPIPEKWLNIYNEMPSHKNHVTSLWWRNFGDENLDSLILEAIENNDDVKISFEKINQNEAIKDASQLALLPKIDGSFNSKKEKLSKNTNNSNKTIDTNNLNVKLNYELDVWGRISSLRWKAKNDLLASKYAKDVVLLNLTSQVAKSYFDLVLLDEELKIAKNNHKALEEIYSIWSERNKVGSTSLLDLRQIEAEKEVEKTRVYELEQKIALLQNEVSLLIGSNPKKIVRSKFENLKFIADKSFIIPALKQPVEIIKHRPDLKMAEAGVIASKADLNASRASFFPSITLDALFGFQAGSLEKLVKSGSYINSFGGGILQPIFNRGELLAQNNIAFSKKDEALYNYAKTLKTALKEVEDSLIYLNKAEKISGSIKAQVDALKEAEKLVEAKYDNGLVGYLEFLTTKRNLFDARINSLEAQRAEIYSYVNFIKALGGGWEDEYHQ